MSTSPLLWLNGSVIGDGHVALSLADAGFLWGAVVVDRLRTFRREVFRLPEHLRRFRSNCAEAHVSLQQTDEQIVGIIAELVSTHRHRGELTIVLFATPGTPDAGPTLGVQVEPINFSRYASWVNDGVHLEPVPDRHAVDPVIKHRSRLAWWIAKQQAPAGREPLFTSDTPERLLRETASANFVAAIDGHLYTPRHEVLDGVSLMTVRELAGKLEIPFIDRPLSLDEVLERASECLLTSTTFCLAPVVAVGEKRMPERRGPVFAYLLTAWSEMAGVDIASQFATNR